MYFICQVCVSFLPGITCYVEVRSGTENRSEAVKKELLSLGAKVEKNFTRKVTIVVFKEGLVSTYLKAKKWGVTMVSILWIEACKIARGQVDPSLYPPLKMKKYESILPFQTIKKRRLRFNKKKKENVDPCSPSLIEFKRNGRNAVTEAKLVPKVSNNSKERHSKSRFCTKKLNFADLFNESKNIVEDTDIVDLDTSSFPTVNLSDLPRRVSAPSCLGRNLKSRQRKLFEFQVLKNVKQTKPLFSNEQFENENGSFHKENNDDQVDNVENVRKKRKLFDPKKSYLSQDLPSDKTCEPVPIPSAYLITTEEKKFTKPSAQKLKQNVVSECTKKKPKTILTVNDAEMNSSVTRRSSLSLFVLSKRTPPSKHPPTLVFTSIRRSELRPFEEMVYKLGVFKIENKVSSKTSHVVCNGVRRTINLLKGLVRGCWILELGWLLQSNSAGVWLPEDRFELNEFSPAVSQCRLERQAFGKKYYMDIFSNCGPVYVSHNSKPPHCDLTELLRLAKAKIVTQASVAEIIIGGKNNKTDSVRVKENWVLDSITQNILLDIKDYTY